MTNPIKSRHISRPKNNMNETKNSNFNLSQTKTQNINKNEIK